MRATIKEIEAALQTGNLAQLKEWVKNGDRFKRNRYNLTDGNNKALRMATEYGQLEAVKWLVEECGSTMIPTHPGLRADIKRCTPRYISDDEEAKTPWFMDACRVAIHARHYDVAEWLLRQSSNKLSPTEFYDVISSLLFITMPMSEDEEYVGDETAISLFKIVFAFISSDTEQIQKLFDAMLSYATVDWVKWLFQNSEVKINVVVIDSINLLGSRQEDGGFEILKWLIEESGQFAFINSDIEQIQRLFDDMLIFATVDQVKWLQSSEVKIRITIENIVMLGYRSDDDGFEILKWLIEESGQFTFINSTTAQIQRLFDVVLSNATVARVKWWLQHSGAKISVTIDDIAQIGYRQEDSGLDVLKWLIEDSGQIIDCRDRSKYRDQIWNQKVVDYLDTVKQAQDLSGVEDGIKAMRLKAKSRDAARRRI